MDQPCRLESLVEERDGYLKHCLADSTFRTYESGLRQYRSFCSWYNLVAFPLSESTLELFVCSMARRLAFSSIKVYLCSVQFHATLNGDNTRISDMSHLYYVLRGIRISIGSSRSRPRRLPITIRQLNTLVDYIHAHYSFFDALMLHAAVSLAFFGLLRSAEYTSPSTSRASANGLCRKDISFSNNILMVHIRGSKTDPFKNGITIRIGPNFSKVCPVLAMSRFLSVSSSPNGPVFRFADGTFLTRSFLSSLLSSCFPETSINTHSFRIGGASTAASVGIPDSIIQTLGRWASNAYRRYVQFSDDSIADFSRRMSSSIALNRIWDSNWLISKRSNP